MALRARRSCWRGTATTHRDDRARWRFHTMIFGMLLMGLASLLWAPGGLSAASQQLNAGGGQTGATAGVDQQALKAEETLISPNDLLFIQVFDVEQMTREYRVNTTGTVDLPLLPDPVLVAGLTPEQAAKAISQKCIAAGVLSRPQITVTIRESRVHAVAVSGAVKNPQIYPVFGRVSLLDILTQAGGVAEDAGSTVTITRGEISRRVLAASAEPGRLAEDLKSASDPATPAGTVNINIQRLLEASDPSLNIDIYPGDRVAVQRAGIVYVVGAVSHAGGFRLTEANQNMTVLKAIALSGSLGPFAKAQKAVLLRADPSAPGGRDQISINLRAMLRGTIADRPLLNNDILFVPDSTMLKALHRGADVLAMGVSYAGAVAIVQ
jgi:polysaccharide biosynthesis/export protein